ncbi:hypothetical protein EIP91_007067 [Steccherinum ochraceum]|uniref:DUF202 domain-containing protein n=1 Tax=Steccherinum ochraceum TaxID=92696 RepID=A0A4V2MVF9_9APHY|nr:hypothetical protein EIP91_007067 [Steccherinum ochraceum]
MSRPRRLYRGHRADSFHPEDVAELIELRARERTFDGAYSRTAVGCLSFAVTVLRLFDRRLFRIGIVYVVLAVALYGFSYLRGRRSRHDFADQYLSEKPPIVTQGQQNKRIFGRPFVTPGWHVLGVFLTVLGIEIGLLVLIFTVGFP